MFYWFAGGGFRCSSALCLFFFLVNQLFPELRYFIFLVKQLFPELYNLSYLLNNYSQNCSHYLTCSPTLPRIMRFYLPCSPTLPRIKWFYLTLWWTCRFVTLSRLSGLASTRQSTIYRSRVVTTSASVLGAGPTWRSAVRPARPAGPLAVFLTITWTVDILNWCDWWGWWQGTSINGWWWHKGLVWMVGDEIRN